MVAVGMVVAVGVDIWLLVNAGVNMRRRNVEGKCGCGERRGRSEMGLVYNS